MSETEEIIQDFFAFEAAARGPESRFAVGDLVNPSFSCALADGVVVSTASARWAKDNLYPCNPYSFAAQKWDAGAVQVDWPGVGLAWWPTYSLVGQ